jgi:hypothetical protein
MDLLTTSPAAIIEQGECEWRRRLFRGGLGPLNSNVVLLGIQ